MINRLLEKRISFLGHLCLIMAISVDFLRRNNANDHSLVLNIFLSIIGLLTFFVGGFLFTMHPQLFFFGNIHYKKIQHQPKFFHRLIAWVFVTIIPVFWLLLSDILPNFIESELIIRFIGSYIFFTWITIVIIISPWLFHKSHY